MARKRTSVIWKLSDEKFTNLIKESSRIKDVFDYFGFKNSGGGNWRTVKKRIEEMGLDSSHFKKSSDASLMARRLTKEDFINNWLISGKSRCSTGLKRYLVDFDMLSYKCSGKGCDLKGDWLGRTLVLQLDHIDGDSSNNKLENLRFLCPNCHSQTETFSGRNNKIVNKCKCGKAISKKSKLCSPCASKISGRKRRVFEVSRDELYDLVCIQKQSYKKIGMKFGVSDNSIRSRCVKLGINPKTRKMED